MGVEKKEKRAHTHTLAVRTGGGGEGVWIGCKEEDRECDREARTDGAANDRGRSRRRRTHRFGGVAVTTRRQRSKSIPESSQSVPSTVKQCQATSSVVAWNN